jgi:hypothetical protein
MKPTYCTWTLRCLAALAGISLIFRVGCGALVLTTEVIPIPGLDGFQTYQITATSDFGNVVAFDFSRLGSYGIEGPLHQINPYGQPTIYNNPGIGDYDPLRDTQFLFNSNDVLSLFPEESESYMHGAFSFIGDRQLTIGNSVPFVRIATDSAADVRLKGSFVVRRPNDEYVEYLVDSRLSDITVGAAPHLEVLPIPKPPEPPPIPNPVPSTNPPVTTPISSPPNPAPPNPATPIPVPAVPDPAADLGKLFMTAEVAPTVDRPGFNTYRITATSNLGKIVGADLTKLSMYGVTGPLGQVSFGQSAMFANQSNTALGNDPSQDTHFLVSSDDVLSLFTEKSDTSFHGAFAFMHDQQLAATQSLPFLQVSTADPSQVQLKGSIIIRRANDEYLVTNSTSNFQMFCWAQLPKWTFCRFPSRRRLRPRP